MSKYFEATSGVQPPISRRLAKKMHRFFASAIEESDVEQETATTTADIVSTSRANVASVEQTVPPPAHSHYTHASVHAYSNFPTGTASHSYLNVPVLSTATVTTSAASRPHVHYDPEQLK